MTTIKELIEENGFIQTVRAFSPSAHERMMEKIQELGPVKGAIWFTEPNIPPMNFEDRAGHTEGGTSGSFYYGPVGDSFIRVWFQAVGIWRNQQSITWDVIDVDPRTCHYPAPCDHDWDDEDGCENCEADEDMCIAHNTYH